MLRPHVLIKLKRFVFILKHAFKMTLVTKKRPLQPYLALYMQFSRSSLFTKAMPTNYIDLSQLQLLYKQKKKTPKTCLTNHKGSVSHHIMPLVINKSR